MRQWHLRFSPVPAERHRDYTMHEKNTDSRRVRFDNAQSLHQTFPPASRALRGSRALLPNLNAKQWLFHMLLVPHLSVPIPRIPTRAQHALRHYRDSGVAPRHTFSVHQCNDACDDRWHQDWQKFYYAVEWRSPSHILRSPSHALPASDRRCPYYYEPHAIVRHTASKHFAKAPPYLPTEATVHARVLQEFPKGQRTQ